MKKINHFEDILKEVGSLGSFQWTVYVLIQYSQIFQTFNQNLMAFGKIQPPFLCGDNFSNESVEINTQCPNTSICHIDNAKVQFKSIVMQWNLYCQLSYVPITIVSIQMLGIIPGSFIFNHLIDNYGRKWSSHLLNVGVLLLGVSSAFAWNWQVFAVLRFFIGFLFGGLFMVSVVYQMEVIEEKDRTWVYCLDCWSVGNCLLSVLAFLTRDWQILVIVSNCFAIPLIFLWFFIPESPRWLLQQGRTEEALTILNRIARLNKRQPVTLEMIEPLATPRQTKNAERKLIKQHNFCDIFKTRKSTIYFLTLAFAWLNCSCISYSLVYDNTSWAGNPFLNYFLAGALRIVFQVVFFFGDRQLKLSRRLQYLIPLTTVVLLTTFVVGMKMFPTNRVFDIMSTVLGLLSTGFIGLIWLIIYLLPIELFPTVIRHIAMGGCSISARIGGILGPQMLNLKQVWPPIPYLVFAVLGWINLISVYFFIPETRNKPLPDSLADTLAPVTPSVAFDNIPDDEEKVVLNRKMSE